VPPTVDGASSRQRSRVVRCHCARATSFGVTPKALCSSRHCRSSSSSDSESVGWIGPRTAGVPPARVPDELPTASTRGGPKGGAPAGHCRSRGEGRTPTPPRWDSASVDFRPAPGGRRASVVGVRPGSSGRQFDSPATVPPPAPGTALPPTTRATAPNAGVAPRSPAGGASVTRLVPGISNGGAPPSSG